MGVGPRQRTGRQDDALRVRHAATALDGGRDMALDAPILVTGAAGRMGGVGGTVVEILRQRDLPVRALVRQDDARAEALRATGAEVVVGDSPGREMSRRLWQAAAACISA